VIELTRTYDVHDVLSAHPQEMTSTAAPRVLRSERKNVMVWPRSEDAKNRHAAMLLPSLSRLGVLSARCAGWCVPSCLNVVASVLWEKCCNFCHTMLQFLKLDLWFHFFYGDRSGGDPLDRTTLTTQKCRYHHQREWRQASNYTPLHPTPLQSLMPHPDSRC
jgi:hypothetical protein